MTSQKIWCWGDNAYGQLGQGDDAPRTAPVAVVSTLAWDQLSVGWDHTCAIDVDDRLFCWGRPDDGRLGHDRGDQRIPVQVGSRDDWLLVSASARTTCGHADNTTFCWGANEVGQLGVGDLDPRSTPTEVAGDRFSEDYAVAAGGNESTGHVAFIERNPVIIVFQEWVLLTAGGGIAGGNRPTPDEDGSTWSPSAVISAGGEHTCLINSGDLYCGGANTTRQLGRVDTTAPEEVGSDDDWTQVSAGSRHTCGRRGTTIYCWGDNTANQSAAAGNPIDTPTRIGALDGWTDISAGVDHSCAVRGGLVYCWGSNASNQSGLGVGVTGQTAPDDYVVFP
jgi:alpha-tubulin suppressor-like RCC1 family protein